MHLANLQESAVSYTNLTVPSRLGLAAGVPSRIVIGPAILLEIYFAICSVCSTNPSSVVVWSAGSHHRTYSRPYVLWLSTRHCSVRGRLGHPLPVCSQS